MREIKVRAWHIKQKRFIDINGLSIAFGMMPNKNSVYGITEQGVLKEYDISEIILELFTGLKDKNGVEIYEGDILKLGDTCSFIVWGLSGWRFNSYMERGLSNLYRYVDTTNGKEIAEIIGNIHENPELLK